jgi:hypothetical protein
VAGRPIKELHIKRRDGKPLTFNNYRGELQTFGKICKVAGAFQGQHSVTLSFDKGFSLVMPGTGEVIPLEDLWIDLVPTYEQRQQRGATTPPEDDGGPLPF